MGFSTKECAWSQTSLKVLGRTLVGIRGFEYKKTVEKDLIYGAGGKPIDIQEGNEKVEGHLKLLKYEVDMMNEAAQAAGYKDGILKVPHEAITATVYYKKNVNSPMKKSTIYGIAFTELPYGLDQGAKFMEINMPFIAMDLEEQ